MREVRIIGTAHVSKKSVEEVERAIRDFQPDVVAVELDLMRFRALADNRELSFREVLSRGNLNFLTLFSAILTHLQRRIGEDFGIKPGEEILRAVKIAQEVGAAVYFIDRPLEITFRRLWKQMSLREKLKLFLMLILSFFFRRKIDVESMKQEEIASALIEELRKISPSVSRVLVDERDAYMASMLLKVPEDKRILAVVGAGHVRGIKDYLQNPEKIPNLEDLLKY